MSLLVYKYILTQHVILILVNFSLNSIAGHVERCKMVDCSVIEENRISRTILKLIHTFFRSHENRVMMRHEIHGKYILMVNPIRFSSLLPVGMYPGFHF